MTARNMSNPRFILPLVLTAGLLLAGPGAANQAAAPSWTPQSSEKLVKLPATYLKKSIESDFAESTLGLAIAKTDENSGMKLQTLRDLRNAVEQAEGDVQTELRHQFLGEKRAYLDLVAERNRLQRSRLAVRRKLFERMLEKLDSRSAEMTKAKRQLVDKQTAARQRFESSFEKVDLRLFETSAVPESRYGRKHAENMAVIEQLVSRIKQHRMNNAVEQDGRALTKEEYIRGLLAETLAEISLLDQEETIIGYMAKLVALDALGLAEQTLDQDAADSDTPGAAGPAIAAEFFLNN